MGPSKVLSCRVYILVRYVVRRMTTADYIIVSEDTAQHTVLFEVALHVIVTT